MINHKFINHGDKLYYIYRMYKESHVKKEKINELKELLECDIILKNKNNEDYYLFFLKEVTELEILT
jgi:hypothetical protein